MRPLCPKCGAPARPTSSADHFTCDAVGCNVLLVPLRRPRAVVPPPCADRYCAYAYDIQHPKHGTCEEGLCLDRTMPHMNHHRIGWSVRRLDPDRPYPRREKHVKRPFADGKFPRRATPHVPGLRRLP